MNDGEDPILEALNRSATEMTSEDIDKVVAYLRRSHHAYEKGEKAPKAESGASLLVTLGLKGAIKPQTLGLKRRI